MCTRGYSYDNLYLHIKDDFNKQEVVNKIIKDCPDFAKKWHITSKTRPYVFYLESNLNETENLSWRCPNRECATSYSGNQVCPACGTFGIPAEDEEEQSGSDGAIFLRCVLFRAGAGTTGACA